VDRIRPGATAKGITVLTEVPIDLPQVSADAGPIGRALFNLLDNAARFSPVSATITVPAGCAPPAGTTTQGKGRYKTTVRATESIWPVAAILGLPLCSPSYRCTGGRSASRVTVCQPAAVPSLFDGFSSKLLACPERPSCVPLKHLAWGVGDNRLAFAGRARLTGGSAAFGDPWIKEALE
jgi:hypothetical protein